MKAQGTLGPNAVKIRNISEFALISFNGDWCTNLSTVHFQAKHADTILSSCVTTAEEAAPQRGPSSATCGYHLLNLFSTVSLSGSRSPNSPTYQPEHACRQNDPAVHYPEHV